MVSLIVIVLVLLLTYYCTKKLSKSAAVYSSSKNIKIIDKAPLGQNKFLVIIQIGDKKLLLSVTENSISLVRELDDIMIEEAVENNNQGNIFSNILNEFIKKDKSV